MRMVLQFGVAAAVAALALAACSDDEPGSSSGGQGNAGATAGATTGGATTGGTTGAGTGGGGGSGTGGGSTTGSTTTTTSTGGNVGPAAQVVSCDGVQVDETVEMKLPDFKPVEMTIEVGQIVEFKNTDVVPHSSTSGTVEGMTPAPDGRWDTGLVEPGDSACVKFGQPGAYAYYDSKYPAPMQATITVE